MRRAGSFALTLALVLTAPGALLTGGCKGETQRPDGGSGLLSEGDSPPELRAEDHRGTSIDLRDLGGKTTLVYFYPRDNTPGCTAEACAIRDVWDRYSEADIRVVGVSADDDASHRAFAQEHELPFALVADPGLEWASAFGVGTMMGMTDRVSFLIGPDGKIARVYPGVDPGVHAEQVLADAKAL